MSGHRFVAFLRGLNVGGHRVKMDRLRELFEEMAFEGVSTFIASGNVLFTANTSDVEQLAKTIEEHLEERLGYSVATFLRSPEQVRVAAAFDPDDPARSACHVIFLKTPPSVAVRRDVTDLASDHDAFHFRDTEIYWCLPGKLSDSPLFAGDLDRALKGVQTTMRNQNTLRRLAARDDLVD